MTGEIDVGANVLSEALACNGATDPDYRAGALGLHGWLLANGPSLEDAVAATTDAYSMLDRVQDPWVRGMVVSTHVMALYFAGRLDQVDELLPQLREIADAADDEWVDAIARLVEAEILQIRGHTHGAQEAYLAAAAAFERHGDRFAYALAITEAAEVAETLGQYDRAVEMLSGGLAIADEVGFSGHPLAMRGRLANVEVLRGNLDVAESIHRSLLDDPQALRVPWLQAMLRVGLAAIARRRGDLDLAAANLDRAWRMPRTQSVPYMRALVSVAFGLPRRPARRRCGRTATPARRSRREPPARVAAPGRLLARGHRRRAGARRGRGRTSARRCAARAGRPPAAGERRADANRRAVRRRPSRATAAWCPG